MAREAVARRNCKRRRFETQSGAVRVEYGAHSKFLRRSTRCRLSTDIGPILPF